jgi:uncharacterized membrane-anchored protein
MALKLPAQATVDQLLEKLNFFLIGHLIGLVPNDLIYKLRLGHSILLFSRYVFSRPMKFTAVDLDLKYSHISHDSVSSSQASVITFASISFSLTS